MQFDNLMECLRVNDIRVHKNFKKAYQVDGCIAAYRELFDGIVRGIETAVYIAINHGGFSRGLREELKKMSELLVKISHETTTARLRRLTQEAESIHANIERDLPKVEGETDMKTEILNRIAGYKEGIEVLLSMEAAESRKPILKECLTELDRLEVTLAEVADTTSPEALKYAEQVTEKLKKWADEVARMMHTAATPRMLGEAIATVKDWSVKLREAHTGLFGRSKKANIDSIRFRREYDHADLLTQIAMSRDYIVNCSNFQSNLEDYESSMQKRYSNTLHEETLAACNKRLDEITAEKTKLRLQYENGEISRDELGQRAAKLKDEWERLLDKVDAAEEKIESNNEIWESYRDVFELLHELLSVINNYRDTDPDMIAFIGEEIDFEALYYLMRGRATRDDENTVLALQDAERIVEREAHGNLLDFRDSMRRGREEHRAAARAQRESRNSQERTGERDTRRKARRDDAADWILGEELPPVETEQEANRNEADPNRNPGFRR